MSNTSRNTSLMPEERERLERLVEALRKLGDRADRYHVPPGAFRLVEEGDQEERTRPASTPDEAG